MINRKMQQTEHEDKCTTGKVNKISLCSGKYTIIWSEDLKVFKALRYGEEWRDLCGDNLILALCQFIMNLTKMYEQ